MSGTHTTITAGVYRASYAITDAGFTLTNLGTIGGYGVSAGAFATAVENAGTIAGSPYYGIFLAGGGSVTNLAGATIAGATALAAGDSASVANAGSILGNAYGVQLTGGSVTNQVGGTITGRQAIEISQAPGAVVNDGGIIGSGSYGVQLISGGTVANHGGAVIGGYHGVQISAGGTVLNAGSIYATAQLGFGVLLVTGGLVSNSSSGTIVGSRGIGVLNAAGTVVNAGRIGGAGIGVYLQAGGSVTNQAGGTITGSAYAVKILAGYAAQLVIDGQAVFGGIVSGGNAPGAGVVSTLRLASTTGIGTLSGLGSEYVGFTQTTIDSGARWVLTGANALAAGYSIANSGSLTLYSGTLDAADTVSNDGIIVIGAATMTVGDLAGSGRVTIAGDGTLEVTGSIASTETIVFAGDHALLHLDRPDAMAGSVVGFGPGDAIDLKGIDAAAVSVSGGTVAFAGGSFALASAGGPPAIAASSDGTELGALCFCCDTLIATPAGLVKVQDLAVGDHVTTRSGEARPIRWIGVGSVLATRGQRSAATPVVLRKHALGRGMPFHDLRVTKGHSILLDDVLIPVEFLVNHRSIAWDDQAGAVALYHIELDTHDVLVANGVPAETYRDDGNRWLFRNANTGWDQPAKPPCAPVLTGGPVVDAAWRRLLDQAGPRPGLPLTAEPDLHLLVDGRRINAHAAHDGAHDGAHVFRLPEQRAEVRIISRAAAPQELGLVRDPRMLGVAIRRIVLNHATHPRQIEAADASLRIGFHAFEADIGSRWTNGDALLPEELVQGAPGPAELILHVSAVARYVAEADDRMAAA